MIFSWVEYVKITESISDSDGISIKVLLREKYIETIENMLNIGLDINLKDKYGDTHLHVASRYGLIKIVRFLIENGANINVTNFNNETPLYISIFEGYQDITDLLLKNGDNINRKYDECHPIDISFKQNNIKSLFKNKNYTGYALYMLVHIVPLFALLYFFK